MNRFSNTEAKASLLLSIHDAMAGKGLVLADLLVIVDPDIEEAALRQLMVGEARGFELAELQEILDAVDAFEPKGRMP